MTGPTTLECKGPTRKAGRYLVFSLADEQYGVEILKVREIAPMTHVAPVPCTPRFVRGVMNLRGKVVPVADLRLRLGMPEAPPARHTCAIVVQLDAGELALVVDRVLEVCGLSAGEIEMPPAFGAAADTSFISGIANADCGTVILLDVETLFARGDLAAAAAAAGDSASLDPLAHNPVLS